MLIQLFSNYLAENGIITTEQMHQIINSKKSTKLPLGDLAVANGFMTKEQAAAVNKEQAKTNNRFGDIAVTMGFISGDNLKALLNMQAKDDFLLDKIITEQGVLSPKELSDQVNQFKKYYNLDDESFQQIVNNNVPVCIEKICGLTSDSGAFQDCASIFVNLFVRFIDRSVLPKKAYRADSMTAKYIFEQTCFGQYSADICLSSDSDSIVKLAERFIKTDYNSFNEDAIDAIKEFLNTLSGLFVAQREKSNEDLNLKTPRFAENKTISGVNHLYILPVSTDIGEFYIALNKIN